MGNLKQPEGVYPVNLVPGDATVKANLADVSDQARFDDLLGEVSTLISRLQGGTSIANLSNEIARVGYLVSGYKPNQSGVVVKKPVAKV